MIRFILKRKFKDDISYLQSEHFETLLLDVPELQSVLCRGGSSQHGYDATDLVGVSIEDAPKAEDQRTDNQQTNYAICKIENDCTAYSLFGKEACSKCSGPVQTA